MMWLREDNAKHDRTAPRHAAVIDVGSNSVRLVIYRLEGRVIWTVYNEKALAGLGRDLLQTGRLSAEGVETAMAALRRFRVVVDGWDDLEVTVAGTAAVREAADGALFVRRVKQETGFAIRVLTGAEEARYAALGVIAGEPKSRGVVGDLGGSSLELIRLETATAEAANAPDSVTLPLGPFALGAPRALEIEPVRRRIEAALAPTLGRFTATDFHAVGGGWRNLALLHMQMAGYPLRVAHQYEINRVDALEVARFVQRQSKSSLEGIEGLSKKRFETLSYSALVLDVLIERMGYQRVVVSAYGLREGQLFEAMSPEIRALDPLVAGADALSPNGPNQAMGPALEAWLRPLFDRLPPLLVDPVLGERDSRLLAAAARLADMGSRLHPDHRGEIAFEQMIRAPLAGMTHPERAFLALTLFARHTSQAAVPEPEAIARLLTPAMQSRARALGAALRLGCDLSGRNPAVLEKSRLVIDGQHLRLIAVGGHGDMLLGEQTAKRAQALAQALRLKLSLGD
jgi:exopolyphosphatase/guanosine-5'-triphosphate,3'-diphosphate pyrophosphatase